MRLKVFYLDDEPDLCENFADQFSSDLVEIFTFGDPPKAISEAELTPPDLFFIDYRLCGTTGVDVAKKLDPRIQKFLVTGDLTIQFQQEFVQILSKPYSEKQIAEILQTAYDRLKELTCPDNV